MLRVFEVGSSKKKAAQALGERTVESFLDFLILAALAKNTSMSVNNLIGYIHQKFKVSLGLGVVYAHLHFLERGGLTIHVTKTKDKGVYRVTSEGKGKIALARKQRNAVQWVIDQILEKDAIPPSP